MIKREKTVNFKVKNLNFGGNSTIYIQSMCNTLTKNIKETVNQILELEALGCDIIRVSILDKEDALSIKEIKEKKL